MPKSKIKLNSQQRNNQYDATKLNNRQKKILENILKMIHLEQDWLLDRVEKRIDRDWIRNKILKLYCDRVADYQNGLQRFTTTIIGNSSSLSPFNVYVQTRLAVWLFIEDIIRKKEKRELVINRNIDYRKAMNEISSNSSKNSTSDDVEDLVLRNNSIEHDNNDNAIKISLVCIFSLLKELYPKHPESVNATIKRLYQLLEAIPFGGLRDDDTNTNPTSRELHKFNDVLDLLYDSIVDMIKYDVTHHASHHSDKLATYETAMLSTTSLALSRTRGALNLYLASINGILNLPQSLKFPTVDSTIQKLIDCITESSETEPTQSPKSNLLFSWIIRENRCLEKYFLSEDAKIIALAVATDSNYLYLHSTVGLIKLADYNDSSCTVVKRLDDFHVTASSSVLGCIKDCLYFHSNLMNNNSWMIISAEDFTEKGYLTLQFNEHLHSTHVSYVVGMEEIFAIETLGTKLVVHKFSVESGKPLDTKVLDTRCGNDYKLCVMGLSEWDHQIGLRSIPDKGLYQNNVIEKIVSAMDVEVHLTANGTAYYIGKGSLINGVSSNSTVLQPLSLLHNILLKDISIDVHGRFTLLLTKEGDVFARGDIVDVDGKIHTTRRLPYKVESLSGKGITQITVFNRRCAAISQDGVLYMWGIGSEHGDLGHNFSYSSSLPASSSQSTFASGEIPSPEPLIHQAGAGSDLLHKPVIMVSVPREVQGLRNEKVVQVALGEKHTLALVEYSKLYSFGCNSEGQCGQGKERSIKVPTLVSSIPPVGVKQISAGPDFSLVLLQDGSVMGFGANNDGQLGTGDFDKRRTPDHIPILDSSGRLISILSVTCGSHHSVFLASDGTVLLAGKIEVDLDQDGVAKIIKYQQPIPTKLPGLTNVISISASGKRSYFILRRSPFISADGITNSAVISGWATNDLIGILFPFSPPTSTQGYTMNLFHSFPISFFRIFSLSSGKYMCDQPLSSRENCCVTCSCDPLNGIVWGIGEKGIIYKCEPDLQLLKPFQFFNDQHFTIDLEFVQKKFFQGLIQTKQQSPLGLACLALGSLDCRIASAKAHSFAPFLKLRQAIGEDSHVTDEEKTISMLDCCERFPGMAWGEWYYSETPDAITFRVDRSIGIIGIALYGGEGLYHITVYIVNGSSSFNTNIIASSSTQYESSNSELNQVIFDEPIWIAKNCNYTVIVRMNGPKSVRGCNGVAKVVTKSGVTFHFQTTKGPNNGTDVNIGQVPIIYFYNKSDTTTVTVRKSPRNLDWQTLCDMDNESKDSNLSEQGIRSLASIINTQLDELSLSCKENDMKRAVMVSYCIVASLRIIRSQIPKLQTDNSSIPGTSRSCVVGEVIAQLVHDLIRNRIFTSHSTFNTIAGFLQENIIKESIATFETGFHLFYPSFLARLALVSNLYLISRYNLPFPGINVLLNSVTNSVIRISSRDELCRMWKSDIPTDISRFEMISSPSANFLASMQSTLENFYTSHSSNRRYHTVSSLLLDNMSSDPFSLIMDNPGKLNSNPYTKAETSSLSASKLICNIIHALANEVACESIATNYDESRTILMCNRFGFCSDGTWGYEGPTKDCISFKVNRSIELVGLGLYGGGGNYEVQIAIREGRNPSSGNNIANAVGEYECWDDTINEIHFPSPVPIKAHHYYSAVCKITGPSSRYGELGKDCITTEEGLQFRFKNCHGENNGTHVSCGQIPVLLYYCPNTQNAPSSSTTIPKGPKYTRTSLRRRSVAQLSTNYEGSSPDSPEDLYGQESSEDLKSCLFTILHTTNQYFEGVIDACSSNPMNYNISLPPLVVNKIGSSPMISFLLPTAITQLLGMISNPEIASDVYNQAYPLLELIDSINSRIHEKNIELAENLPCSKCVIESPHPYEKGMNLRHTINMGEKIKWITVEFDTACSTLSNSDRLIIYTDPSCKHPLHNQTFFQSRSNKSWKVQSKPLIFAGNSLTFEFQTSCTGPGDPESNDMVEERFGFRCTVNGYEFPSKTPAYSLRLLEQDLAFLCASCAHSLVLGESEPQPVDKDIEDVLRSKVVERGIRRDDQGHSLPPVDSFAIRIAAEKTFIKEFIEFIPDTPGTRLAQWLQQQIVPVLEKSVVDLPYPLVDSGTDTVSHGFTKEENYLEKGHLTMEEDLIEERIYEQDDMDSRIHAIRLQQKAIRAVYAALMWHHGVVADAMGCAAFLRFQYNLVDSPPIQLHHLKQLWIMVVTQVLNIEEESKRRTTNPVQITKINASHEEDAESEEMDSSDTSDSDSDSGNEMVHNYYQRNNAKPNNNRLPNNIKDRNDQYQNAFNRPPQNAMVHHQNNMDKDLKSDSSSDLFMSEKEESLDSDIEITSYKERGGNSVSCENIIQNALFLLQLQPPEEVLGVHGGTGAHHNQQSYSHQHPSLHRSHSSDYVRSVTRSTNPTNYNYNYGGHKLAQSSVSSANFTGLHSASFANSDMDSLVQVRDFAGLSPRDRRRGSFIQMNSDRDTFAQAPSASLIKAIVSGSDSTTFILGFVMKKRDLEKLKNVLTRQSAKAIYRVRGIELFLELLNSIHQYSALIDILWLLSSSFHSRYATLIEVKVPPQWSDPVGAHPTQDLICCGASSKAAVMTSFYNLYERIVEVLESPSIVTPNLQQGYSLYGNATIYQQYSDELVYHLLRCWFICLKPTDHFFVQDCGIFRILRKIMSAIGPTETTVPSASLSTSNNTAQTPALAQENGDSSSSSATASMNPAGFFNRAGGGEMIENDMSQKKNETAEDEQIHTDHSNIESLRNGTIGEEGIVKEFDESEEQGSNQLGISYTPQQPVVYVSDDVTRYGLLSSSSASLMLPSLLVSADSFWESEPNDSPPYIQIKVEKLIIDSVSLYIDNVRDKDERVVKMKLMGGSTPNYLCHLCSKDVDRDYVGWVTLTNPNPSHSINVLRVVLVGNGLVCRVRMFKCFSSRIQTLPYNYHSTSATTGSATPSNSLLSNINPSIPVNANINASTVNNTNTSDIALQVFRLLTSQVFGGLMATEEARERSAGLREHVAALLFVDEKRGLSDLQIQVFENLFGEITRESSRLQQWTDNKMKHRWWKKRKKIENQEKQNQEYESEKENDDHNNEKRSSEGSSSYENNNSDFETDMSDDLEDELEELEEEIDDNYCFELVSMLLSLSVSKVGQQFITSSAELIRTLLLLISIGTPRIQRQVIPICHRVLPLINPSSIKSVCDTTTRTIRDGSVPAFLLMVAGKGFVLQLRSKENTSTTNVTISREKSRDKQEERASTRDVMISTTMDEASSYSIDGLWVVGSVDTVVAMEVIQLISSLRQSLIEWKQAIDGVIRGAISGLHPLQKRFQSVTQISHTPELWLSIAALCVIGRNPDLVSAVGVLRKAEDMKICDNHDDGITEAIWVCFQCNSSIAGKNEMNYCGDCDRILHLPKEKRTHRRLAIVSEGISVDVHEGCSRAKMSTMMIVVNNETCKAIIQTKQQTGSISCRFCKQPLHLTMNDKRRLTMDINANVNVCDETACREKSLVSCQKTHPCGHLCGGIKGEQPCLPCLYCHSTQKQNDPNRLPLKQDADDICMICWVENLHEAPAIQLKCGHVVHYLCARKLLEKKWVGPRISFGFCQCPVCRIRIEHNSLQDLLKPVNALYEDVRRMALVRAEYMGLNSADEVVKPNGRFYNDLAGYAMDRLHYYQCSKCHNPYFGGEQLCNVNVDVADEFNPNELVCGGCSSATAEQNCPVHGRHYLEFKCRYCCSTAVWFCFGTTHFCEGCHSESLRLIEMSKEELPSCPVGPRATPLGPGPCPLMIDSHPPTGEEFALGCGICRNTKTF